MGQREDTDTAASRLAQLNEYFHTHPVTSAEGHSYTAFAAHTPRTTSPMPYDAALVHHIGASVAEVVHHTRAVNPEAGPLPGHVAGVYAWARQHTEHAPDTDRQRAATLEYRHYLEHAIAAGDTDIVRPHRCPACGTYGLHWPAGTRDPKATALCVNLHCARDNKGIHRRWSLAQLAHEHVATEKTLRECAT